MNKLFNDVLQYMYICFTYLCIDGNLSFKKDDLVIRLGHLITFRISDRLTEVEVCDKNPALLLVRNFPSVC